MHNLKDRITLQFALQISNKFNLPLKIIHPKINYEFRSKQKFIDKQIKQVNIEFKKQRLDFQIVNKTPSEILSKTKTAALIIDFNPILDRSYLKNFKFKIDEIDSHNIIPARYVSDKQEYSVATLREKFIKENLIYRNIFYITKVDIRSNILENRQVSKKILSIITRLRFEIVFFLYIKYNIYEKV